MGGAHINQVGAEDVRQEDKAIFFGLEHAGEEPALLVLFTAGNALLLSPNPLFLIAVRRTS